MQQTCGIISVYSTMIIVRSRDLRFFCAAAFFLYVSVMVQCNPVPSHRERANNAATSTLEAFYYKTHANLISQFTRRHSRQGNPTKTHSCSNVRAVPKKLRGRYNFGASGIDPFYNKYTEAYGIPVIGSSRVPDEALQRACYVLRFVLADNEDLRSTYYKMYGRVAVMGRSEVTKDIPEHKNLSVTYSLVRGLGAVEVSPVTTVGEENVACHRNDVHNNEDILLREMAHGIHLLGAKLVWKHFQRDLEQAYKYAMQGKKWKNTYAAHSVDSYFAEGVQSYLDANGYSNPPDGVHNEHHNAVKLASYDPLLYSLVRKFFPCGNTYLKRCRRDRARTREFYQKLKMDCGHGYWTPKIFN